MDLDFFAPQQVEFLFSEVTTQSDSTYTETRFQFIHTLATNVNSDAILFINIPPEIEIFDPEKVVESCKSAKSLDRNLACELEILPANNRGMSRLTVRNAIPERGLTRFTQFVLQITEGLKTPISVQTSRTFRTKITDGNLNEINYVDSALTITMKEGADVGFQDLVIDNYDVGATNIHELSFITPTPLLENFVITIDIPKECESPMQ